MATTSRAGATERLRIEERPLTGGGTSGNEQLTAATGVLLLVLFAVIGVSIIRIGQLMWLHLFVGILLVGPLALKLASTGYRFTRYYTGDAAYRRKGPPPAVLRGLAPLVILATLAVFLTGFLLLIEGPSHRNPLGLLHKVSFFAWAAVTGLHVLIHLPELPRALTAVRRRARRSVGRPPGSRGRRLALVGAVTGGALLALLLLPDFAAWTTGPHF